MDFILRGRLVSSMTDALYRQSRSRISNGFSIDDTKVQAHLTAIAKAIRTHDDHISLHVPTDTSKWGIKALATHDEEQHYPDHISLHLAPWPDKSASQGLKDQLVDWTRRSSVFIISEIDTDPKTAEVTARAKMIIGDKNSVAQASRDYWEELHRTHAATGTRNDTVAGSVKG